MGSPARLKFHLNSNVTPVLGQNTGKLLNLVKRVHTANVMPDEDIFQSMRSIKDCVCDANIKEEDTESLMNEALRCVPYALMKEIKEKLTTRYQKVIVEKIIEPTPFCSKMVVKQRGKIRIRRNYLFNTLEEIVTHVRCNLLCRPQEWFLANGSVGMHQKVSGLQHPVGQVLFKRVPFGIAIVPEVFSANIYAKSLKEYVMQSSPRMIPWCMPKEMDYCNNTQAESWRPTEQGQVCL